jgi:23S rRNA pseudouridine2605 synthase
VAERIQKVLARAGFASRRSVEEMIKSGRISINDEVAALGAQVDPCRDTIRADGKQVRLSAEQPRYLLLNKPRGVVSTLRDPQARPTIRHLLKGVLERVYPAGRLDLDSEGLILCTNDGLLAERLLHPRYRVWKTYHVEVEGDPTEDALGRLRSGVVLDGRPTAQARVRRLSGRPAKTGRTVLEVQVHEGRKQQVRRMFELVGHPVIRLQRTAVGPLRDYTLPPGHWRDLTGPELALLRGQLGLS